MMGLYIIQHKKAYIISLFWKKKWRALVKFCFPCLKIELILIIYQTKQYDIFIMYLNYFFFYASLTPDYGELNYFFYIKCKFNINLINNSSRKSQSSRYGDQFFFNYKTACPIACIESEIFLTESCIWFKQL